jgi:hypothetical protein
MRVFAIARGHACVYRLPPVQGVPTLCDIMTLARRGFVPISDISSLNRAAGVVATVALCMLAAATSVARADFPAAARAFDAGDYASAAAQWRGLAARCDARAQTALAGLFHAGLGVPRNDVEALRWYLMAAWAGERFAQQIVGDWYGRGDVVPADPVRAAFWLSLAADQGLDWAVRRRDAVLATLDPRDREALAGRLAAYPAIAAGMCGRGQ